MIRESILYDELKTSSIYLLIAVAANQIARNIVKSLSCAVSIDNIWATSRIGKMLNINAEYL